MLLKNHLLEAFYLPKEKRRAVIKQMAFIVLGTAIGSFGIYNIHQQTNITEGGVLGMILLLNHWLGVSPSIITPILDILCYSLAFRQLGWRFIRVSIVSTISLAGFFRLWEQFPPLLPNLSATPFLAALLGGLFVGVAVGIIVRNGGSSGGDDALALVISKATKCRLAVAYLATDLSVLLLSLSYIPLQRIVFSLITVTLSSFLIDFIQNWNKAESKQITEPVQQTTNETEALAFDPEG